MAAVPLGRIRPSGWWYLAAVGLVVVGLVLAVVTVVRAFGETRDRAFEVNAAGLGETQTLTIDQPGSFTIGYVGPTRATGESAQRRLADDLAPSVAPAAGGAPLPVRRYDGFYDASEAGEQYVPLFTVRIDVAGEYALRSEALPDVDPERARVVMLKSPFQPLREGLIMAAVLALVGLGLGILAAVILGVNRGRAKRVRAATWPGAGPSQPQPVSPGGGGWPSGAPPGW